MVEIFIVVDADLAAAVFDRLKHRQHIFNRRIALDIMDGIADKAAALVKDVDPLAHLAVDRLRCLVHCVLGVDASTPKSDVRAKILF